MNNPESYTTQDLQRMMQDISRELQRRPEIAGVTSFEVVTVAEIQACADRELSEDEVQEAFEKYEAMLTPGYDVSLQEAVSEWESENTDEEGEED